MGAEPVPPKPNCFMTDVDPTLMEKVFDISERKRKPDIHHNCQPVRRIISGDVVK